MNARLACVAASVVVLQACNCGGRLIEYHELCKDEPQRCADKNFDPATPTAPATNTPSVMPPCQTDEGAVHGRVCATDQVCVFNECRNVAGWVPPIPEDRDEFLATIAHLEDHHPDLDVHYNRCGVAFSTHDAGGITLNDLICAARVEALDA